MKSIRTCLLFAFAVVSLVFVTAAPSMAQSDFLLQVRSGARFTLDREKSDNIDIITSAGPGAPGGHVKVFDGARKAGKASGHVKAFSAGTLQMLRPSESVVITHTTSEVSIKFDNYAPLKSSRNGQPITWTRPDGAKYKLTSWLKNGSLIQVLSSSDETVTRTFTVSGSTLTIKLEASSSGSDNKPTCYLSYKLAR